MSMYEIRHQNFLKVANQTLKLNYSFFKDKLLVHMSEDPFDWLDDTT